MKNIPHTNYTLNKEAKSKRYFGLKPKIIIPIVLLTVISILFVSEIGISLAENAMNDSTKITKASSSAINNSIVSFKANFRIVTIATLIVICIILIIYISYSLRHIKKVMSVSKNIASGNLNSSFNVKTKDEVGQLSGNINLLITKLQILLSEAGEMSNNMENLSGHMEETHRQSSTATEQIAKSISTLASNSMQQVADAQEGSNYLKSGVSKIVEVICTMDVVRSQIINTKTAVDAGLNSIEFQREKMDLTIQSNDSVLQSINTLKDRVDQIGDIVGLISTVSHQTKLLAFNASIEAAKTPEGKGFAVIANEIKKLSDKTRLSTDSIRDLIVEIQESMENTVSGMDLSKDAISAQDEAFKDTIGKFQNIRLTVDQVVETIENIGGSIFSTSQDIFNAESKINEITQIIKNNAEFTEDISASSEQQLANTFEFNDKFDYLSTMVKKLKSSLETFKS